MIIILNPDITIFYPLSNLFHPLCGGSLLSFLRSLYTYYSNKEIDIYGVTSYICTYIVAMLWLLQQMERIRSFVHLVMETQWRSS